MNFFGGGRVSWGKTTKCTNLKTQGANISEWYRNGEYIANTHKRVNRRMKIPLIKVMIGFIVLFGLYHGAEYWILQKNNSWGFLAFQFLFFLSAWLIAKWQFGKCLSAWGLDTRKYFLIHLAIGMFMGILLYGITFLVSLSTGAEEIVGKPNYASSISPFLLFIFGNFFSSFSEDILTRGYVFKHLD